MTAKTLHANGIELAYDEFGNQQDPALLLVMGLGTQMIAWTEEFCLSLAAKGYRVIRFDNRDIGLSQKFDGTKTHNLLVMLLCSKMGIKLTPPYSLKDMADDAVGVLNALKIEKAHIVGTSMGGMISQLVAAYYPERVLSLTSIMSTSGCKSLPGPRREIIKQMIAKRPSNEAEHVANGLKLWRLIGSPSYMPNDEQLRNKILASYRRSYYPQGYVRQLAAIIAYGDRITELKQITAPTLVIHGKADALVPVECGIDTARHIKHSRLELFDGMGHDLPPALYTDFVKLIDETAQAA